jgi:hypothetical protein
MSGLEGNQKDFLAFFESLATFAVKSFATKKNAKDKEL